MIKEFVKAWNKNKDLLLKEFENTPPNSYSDIVETLITIVINPYLKENEHKIDYPMSEGLDIEKLHIIDDGDYQGTTIYIIPFNTYQPSVDEYVYTNNYYGSCSGCDTFLNIEAIYDYDKKEDRIEAAKQFHKLALNLLQQFKKLK